MRRNATLSLEGFDPEVIEAAREVAQRAGVPLESWIASVVSPEAKPARSAPARTRVRVAARPAAVDESPTPARTATESVEAPEIATAVHPTAEDDAPVAEAASAVSDEAPAPADTELPAADGDHAAQVDVEAQHEFESGFEAEAEADAEESKAASSEFDVEDALDEAGPRFAEPALAPAAEPAQVQNPATISAMMRRLDTLDRSLNEDRGVQAAASPAEPRIDHVAERLAEIERRMADMGAQMAAVRPVGRRGRPIAVEMKDALDSVRRRQRELDASEPTERAAVRAQAAGVSRGNGFAGLSSQIAQLQERVDGHPVRELMDRLESLGQTMHRPSEPSAEIASMHALLRGLADKVERVGGGGNLDALENQVVSIAQRLDARGTVDPAMAGLERTMGELMTQIVALRDETSVEAAVERAARKAFAAATEAQGHPSGLGAMDAFRSDLDDLRNRQIASDQRMQSTMDSLNSVLVRLVDRLGMPETVGPIAHATLPDQGAPLGESLRASTALASAKPSPAAAETIPVSAPRSRAARRPERMADESGIGDELLEPGTARPVPPHHGADAAGAAGDIKTSFIAAARRAAQAAQADIAAEAPAALERRDAPRSRVGAPAVATTPGLVGRLFGGLDKRRRPLILALAAVVLAIGAYQAIEPHLSAKTDAQPAGTPSASADPAVSGEAKSAEVATADAASGETKSAEAVAAGASSQPAAPAETEAAASASGPQTTQAIAGPGASTAKPAAESTVPKVAAMAALGRDLAGVPAGLETLKQAALEGNGAAIYELAGREADGRGMPRDLAVAAKLYEKLAEAGYAPAQFKLGSFHEKGSGVVRDIGQAKSWYNRAADQGNVRAMHNIAVLFAENPSATGKPDFATAASWFRRAAEYGVRDSQYNLAVLYARGLGIGQDLVQSYAWFSAAAAQGDEEAGKKRDDIANKLSAKDLASAKAIAAAFKPKPADPAVNEAPGGKAVAPAMSLLTAPPPGTPAGSFVHAGPRTGV